MDELKEKLISLAICALDNGEIAMADKMIDMLAKLNASEEIEEL